MRPSQWPNSTSDSTYQTIHQEDNNLKLNFYQIQLLSLRKFLNDVTEIYRQSSVKTLHKLKVNNFTLLYVKFPITK